MKKRKICVVINNRANYARIKSALIAIKRNNNLELQIVLGSSAILDRYGRVSDIIKKDGFKINRIVYTLLEGENLLTMSKSTGISITSIRNRAVRSSPAISSTHPSSSSSSRIPPIPELYTKIFPS